MENGSWKILWDFPIQTDHVIEARKHDMVIIAKTKNECKIIDLLGLFASRIEASKRNKIQGYIDLKRELKKIWDMPMKVGASGTTPTKLNQRLRDIGTEIRIVEFQKTTILLSARILRNFFEL